VGELPLWDQRTRLKGTTWNKETGSQKLSTSRVSFAGFELIEKALTGKGSSVIVSSKGKAIRMIYMLSHIRQEKVEMKGS
jgi:hypothetical protein